MQQAVSQLRKQITEKVHSGQRLSSLEALFLFSPEADLHWLGQLANSKREQLHGNVAYYNINRHINPTNICHYRCPLCAYSRDKNATDSYCMTIDEVLAQAQQAAESGCTEIHVVGGIHPEMPYSWYRQIVAEIHRNFPNLHIKAWTAIEICWFSKLTGWSVAKVLEDMMEAGLGSLPGGGAEIFAAEVRQRISPEKPSAEQWLEVHRTAHKLGLRTNATMLYGHIEQAHHRVDHLLRLRQLQDETGGFQAFVPLAFHPEGTQLRNCSRATAIEDLRVVAASRLILDNFPHIKAYWVSLGLETAQVALAYGADDFDGTVCEEKIHHQAGSTAPKGLTVEQIVHLICEAGRRPVERDTLYRPVKRQGKKWFLEA